MRCRVCESGDTYEVFRANCGPWYRCLACGSDSNVLTYEDVKHEYQGYTTIDHLMKSCGDRQALKHDQSTNLDWFKRYPGHPKVFLDYGTCTGVGMEGMRDRGYESHGFDVMPEALEFDESIVIAPSFRPELFDGVKFGAILMREVIEHLDDWRQQLLFCREVMAPGGLLQVQTPRPTQAVNELTYQRLHLQIFSPAALKLAFLTLGFEIVDDFRWPAGHAFLVKVRSSR